MTWAADAAGNPDPAALAETGCLFVARYVGTPYQRYGVTRDYVAACHDHGVGVGLIFEEWANQFRGGYDAARQSCARMLAGWDALGAPRDGTVIPMVVLVDPSPSAVLGNEDRLRDYARGWDDALTAAGFREWTGYGSRYGLDLAGEVAPHMTRRWGVGTWGFGERPDGSLPEHVPADMIQHGNRAAPVAGCDYNTLLRLDMGQWAPAAVSAPRPRTWRHDVLMLRDTEDENRWRIILPGGSSEEIHPSVVWHLATQGVPSAVLPRAVVDAWLAHASPRANATSPPSQQALDLLAVTDAVARGTTKGIRDAISRDEPPRA